GRGAHRDGDGIATHLLERGEHRLLEPGRKGRRKNPVTDLRADLGEAGDVVYVQIGERGPDALVETALKEKITVRARRRGKAVRHPHAKLRERADHLAEGGILAADDLDVPASELAERNDVIVAAHRQSGTCRPPRAVKHWRCARLRRVMP